MKDVLAKIEELVKLLEIKNASTDVLNKQLSIQKNSFEEKERVIKAKEVRLSALERVLNKYEDFEKDKVALAKDIQEHKERIALAKKQETNDAATLVQINKEREELKALKLVLDRQGNLIKEKEIAFESKKADLKAMISGQAIKDILK